MIARRRASTSGSAAGRRVFIGALACRRDDRVALNRAAFSRSWRRTRVRPSPTFGAGGDEAREVVGRARHRLRAAREQRLRRVPDRRAPARIAAFSVATTRAGVPAGAKMPSHALTSKPGRPDSAIGRNRAPPGSGCAVDTASPRTLPPFTSGYGVRHHVDHHLHLAADQVGHRQRAAAIGDVNDVDRRPWS